ncbi:glutamate receptor ionotropic, kainate 2-like isoform X10 [Lycorma delicatula]|uniref:glutamate receptor ionotropic, kainate 2-like isoform X10 n=1 Tax=Lycorma delicatula TaxID=130591 RepID=UPI003F519AA1
MLAVTSWRHILFLAITSFSVTLALPPVIKIGAIFTQEEKDSSTELAFKYAVYRINKDRTLLPKTTLVYDIQYVPKDDSFHASKKACQQVQEGVQAVFGPSDPLLGAHIHSICDALDIPHLEARLDLDSEYREFSINLHPAQPLLNNAFYDVIAFLNWTKVAIIYEEDYGLIKLRELVRSPGQREVEIHLRQAEPDTYRNVLKEIKSKEIHNLIIDTRPENMHLFLRGILQLQMNDYKYHYLFTSFDIETFDLEDFKYNFVNMTAFRMVDAEDVNVKEVLKDMQRFQPMGHSLLNKSSVIQAGPALMYDSVLVFAIGLQTLEQSHALVPANVSCEAETPWDGGLSLINYINAVEMKGLSGPIEFKEGRRIQFKLDLLKLKQHSLVKVGEWTPTGGVNISDKAAFFDSGSMNVTLVVITILEQPYVMVKGSENSSSVRYEGFCIDLLREIANMVGFEYRIQLVPDGKYGVYDPDTGEWNGIVRQLMDKKADLAVGSMTINYARESVIDFTKPFMNLGISILFKVPTDKESRFFTFLDPLALEIWLLALVAFITVCLCLYAISRFSPYEWYNPRPWKTKQSAELVNTFTLSNSVWFITGTLLRQGAGLNPKATSTRIVGGIWWFFTLIIISSYTANLAAFLTVERMITPIENAEDLAGQTDISYGTLDSGSTMTFFRDSMIETYKKMWRFMENKKPSVFVPTYEEGIRRVLEGNYAFLMESTMLDYIVQRDCNLTQIGGLLDSKGYGIATPMGSPWRDKISLAILELQEKGEIQMLYDKWWKNPGDTCTRNEKGKESKANALGVDNIGGVFVVLLCGLAIAVIVAIFEFCYNSKRITKMERRAAAAPHQSLCAEMLEELCFALRCRGSRQRPALKRQCSKCVPGTTYVPASFDLPPANNGLRSQRSSMAVSLELPPDLHLHQNNDLEIPKVHQNS